MHIYKYPLPLPQRVLMRIEMPRNSRILSVQVQHEIPQIWALVDLTYRLVKHYFFVAETGQYVDEKVCAGSTYVGTFQLNGGDSVFHLFDLGESKD